MPLRRAGKKKRAPLLGLAKSIYHLGERWRSVEGASCNCGPGSIHGLSVACRLSFLLVLFLAPRVFLWVLRFPPSTKTNISNSNPAWKQ